MKAHSYGFALTAHIPKIFLEFLGLVLGVLGVAFFGLVFGGGSWGFFTTF